ncbi:hypothetical protein [Exilibacterium tricleocarpae]|uniref:hypothetical protein n=1 Tax=Exilibacterium tricleocarpae TaxID=2591008 RepID=UPI00115CC114|nr:hypothetical protein [Exilibacterium tricleocarpae]
MAEGLQDSSFAGFGNPSGSSSVMDHITPKEYEMLTLPSSYASTQYSPSSHAQPDNRTAAPQSRWERVGSNQVHNAAEQTSPTPGASTKKETIDVTFQSGFRPSSTQWHVMEIVNKNSSEASYTKEDIRQLQSRREEILAGAQQVVDAASKKKAAIIASGVPETQVKLQIAGDDALVIKTAVETMRTLQMADSRRKRTHFSDRLAYANMTYAEAEKKFGLIADFVENNKASFDNSTVGGFEDAKRNVSPKRGSPSRIDKEETYYR